LLFCGLYTLLSLTYRFVMPDYIKRSFEAYCSFCNYFGEYIPVYFVLGFFVNTIVERWWDQFLNIPWPDEIAMSLSAYTRGHSERVRIQRRTIMRYINFSYVLAIRDMCSRARLLFPNEFSLVSAGLATQEEILLYFKSAPFQRPACYMEPCLWAQDIVLQMRAEGCIDSDLSVEILCKQIINFRNGLGTIRCYDLISVPLVYTQVAILTVYSYTISSLFAWQFLDPNENVVGGKIDLYVPIFGLLRFIFYMGWIKVAESLINPFGEDQDDFDIDEIIERNLQVSEMSYYIVDSMYEQVPPLSRGVVLEVTEYPESQRQNYEISRRASALGNELFLGSLTNILDDLSDSLCRVADLADCIRALHPDEAYQRAANEVCLRVGNLVESLNTDADLYEAAVRAHTSPTPGPDSQTDFVDKRVLNLFIEDFEQSGVHLKDISDRQAFLRAASKNLELSVEFNRIANTPVTLSSNILSSISKDIDWGPFKGRNLYCPYYEAPQQFLRALTYVLFFSPIEGQEYRLIALLDARDKMAKAAGKKSFLYRAVQQSSLAESPEGVEHFLTTLSTLLSRIATRTALSQLRKDLKPQDERLRPWDVPFLIHQGQQCGGFERLQAYFSLGACMEGVSQLAHSLFGLRLEAEPALPGEVWHPDVVKVAAYTTESCVDVEAEEVHPWEVQHPIGPGVQVGTIYCDFFNRPGKLPTDCHYTVRGGRHTENTMFESHSPFQYPVVVLQLNLGSSLTASKDGTPVLLTPGQVENLFHEWGHALHSVLGRTRYQHVTGTRCSTDLAELPSTLMEHFALDARVTAQYARHFQNGEAPTSDEDARALLHLNASRGYGESVEVMLQVGILYDFVPVFNAILRTFLLTKVVRDKRKCLCRFQAALSILLIRPSFNCDTTKHEQRDWIAGGSLTSDSEFKQKYYNRILNWRHCRTDEIVYLLGQYIDLWDNLRRHRCLVHSILDQRLHSGSPSKVLKSFYRSSSSSPPSALLLENLLVEHCSPWLSVDLPSQLQHLPIATTHRFGHLCNYGGRYYSYLMARAAAGLVWHKGFAGDPWSSDFGRASGTVFFYSSLHSGDGQIIPHERRPQEMLSRLLNEAEATVDMGHLAAGLCEDIAIREEAARVTLMRMSSPSWNLVQ
uniref:Bestrophin homolog n=1 Tax=Hydatigena taeniaeformis TaxID=6205 RepID=A0A0R3WJL2_HYDTA